MLFSMVYRTLVLELYKKIMSPFFKYIILDNLFIGLLHSVFIFTH